MSSKRRRRLGEIEEDAFTANAIQGKSIASTTELMRGHGTFIRPNTDDVLASVAGTVERVNKLISVKPLRGRFRPEQGDLVVGRIVEVGPRRWKVDCGARLDATLMLSSINLPGGVQRRKLESDELQMRAFFKEGDLLVAEVQAFFGDGTVSLHTRSLKYGKLRNGLLVQVSPSSIVRLKSHFVILPCGVELILGLNGLIWIACSQARMGNSSAAPVDAELLATNTLYSSTNDPISADERMALVRVAACVRQLAAAGSPISDVAIAQAYDKSLPDVEGMDAQSYPIERMAS